MYGFSVLFVGHGTIGKVHGKRILFSLGPLILGDFSGIARIIEESSLSGNTYKMNMILFFIDVIVSACCGRKGDFVFGRSSAEQENDVFHRNL
jgi:hypothetical protein